jgi:hypothetical protein
MTPMRRLLALVPTLLIVGCGSASNTSGSPPLAKPQFIRAADSICHTFNGHKPPFSMGKLAAISERYSRDHNAVTEQQVQTLARSFKYFARQARAEVGELRKLSPPEADRAKIDRFLAFESRRAELLSAYAVRLGSGKLTAAEERDFSEKMNAALNGAAEIGGPFGFRWCTNET